MGNTRYSIDKANLSSFKHAKLLYISTSKYEDDWQSIPHSHAFSELFFVTDGKGFFIAENEEFPVQNNDLILINPHVQHTEKSMGASPLEYIVLGIEGLSFPKPSGNIADLHTSPRQHHHYGKYLHSAD